MSNCDRPQENKCIICGQRIDSNDIACGRCAWFAFMVLLNYDELNKALKEDRLHLPSESIKYYLPNDESERIE